MFEALLNCDVISVLGYALSSKFQLQFFKLIQIIDLIGVSCFIVEVFRKDMTAVMPSRFGMFVYKDFTSMVTDMAFCGRYLNTVSILFIKSVVSSTYHLNDFTNGCK